MKKKRSEKISMLCTDGVLTDGSKLDGQRSPAPLKFFLVNIL